MSAGDGPARASTRCCSRSWPARRPTTASCVPAPPTTRTPSALTCQTLRAALPGDRRHPGAAALRGDRGARRRRARVRAAGPPRRQRPGERRARRGTARRHRPPARRRPGGTAARRGHGGRPGACHLGGRRRGRGGSRAPSRACARVRSCCSRGPGAEHGRGPPASPRCSRRPARCPVVVTEVAPPWLGPLDVVVVSHRGSDRRPGRRADGRGGRPRGAGGAPTSCSPAPPTAPPAAAAAGRAMQVVPRVARARRSVAPRPTSRRSSPPPGRSGCSSVDGEALADRLDDEAERSGPRHEAFVAPAKALALRLAEHTPLLWGTDPGRDGPGGLRRRRARRPRRRRRARRARSRRAAAVPALRRAARAGASGRLDLRRPVRRPRTGGAAAAAGRRHRPGGPRRPAGSPTTAARRWPAADVLEIDDVELAGRRPRATTRCARRYSACVSTSRRSTWASRPGRDRCRIRPTRRARRRRRMTGGATHRGPAGRVTDPAGPPSHQVR